MLSALESLPATRCASLGRLRLLSPKRPLSGHDAGGGQQQWEREPVRERRAGEPVFTEAQAQDMGVVLAKATQSGLISPMSQPGGWRLKEATLHLELPQVCRIYTEQSWGLNTGLSHILSFPWMVGVMVGCRQPLKLYVAQ